jgi:hypothetical protein
MYWRAASHSTSWSFRLNSKQLEPSKHQRNNPRFSTVCTWNEAYLLHNAHAST